MIVGNIYLAESKTVNKKIFDFKRNSIIPIVKVFTEECSSEPEFIKKHKLEHVTIYGFRHSFATLMSEKGIDKEVLRELMGHAEFETTDFYYIHVSEERKKKEFEKVNFEEFQGKMKNAESKPIQAKRYFLKKKPQKKEKSSQTSLRTTI